jgi:molecular chaperone Hsp33
MSDKLVRATARGIRLYAVDSAGLVEEACARHGCWALAAAALGRAMTGALLLSATFKENERVMIKLAGDGPLGSVVADAGQMAARGYVENPTAELSLKGGKLDVGGGVGKGKIVVTRFSGLKTPVSGSVDLVSGEVAEDITNYLYVSEQTPSCLSLGVLVGADGKVAEAGGFFIQAMPGADADLLQRIEGRVESLPPVTVLLESGSSPRSIIEQICGKGADLLIHDQTRVAFRCNCSRAGVEKMLLALPAKDINDMAEDEETEVCCHFCNNKYLFVKKEIEKLAAENSK